MVGIRRPELGEQPPKSGAKRVVNSPKSLKFKEVLGPFGFTRHVGFVRLAQPLGSVRLRGDSNSATAPPRPARGSTDDGNFYPISAALATAI
jgi:hypothetical protein